MSEEIDNNRAKLAELVFEMKAFTEEELENRFRAIAVGGTEIRRPQTVRDFLEDLREFGAIRVESGRYLVQKLHPVLG